MENDSELLRKYAHSRSDEAFAELVRRHVDLVYSAALRQTEGDAALAQELTQLVFFELSRKARDLLRHPTLAGWLYTCVRWTAANKRRAQQSRQRRQIEYHTMSQLLSSESPESAWQHLRPILDDALHELGEKDRTAIVLRFFEDLSLQRVGLELGLSENAARMRVERALRKLRDRLSKRGITSTSSALAAAIILGAIVTAPAGLAASISTSAIALGASTGPTASGMKTLKAALGLKKLLLLGAGAFVFGTVSSVTFLWFHPAIALRMHNWLLNWLTR
jgi:RNA polymerase sigma factor (sigma-70 family)